MTIQSTPAPQSVDELEELLSRPPDHVVRLLGELDADLMFLGVGGKMGPTMARMARRALDEAGSKRRVVGVSRFSDKAARERLESWGVETIGCDLLDERSVAALPEAPYVIYLSGMKFGASAAPSLTWAMNCYAPILVCRKFHRSRIVALSSGNVYGMVAADSSGSVEADDPRPQGEYAMTVLGRERMFEHFGQALDIPTVLLRLNYAAELRYGVQVDLAEDVKAGRPVDVSMNKVNFLWLGDANAMTLAALAHCKTPARVLNMAGDEIVALRDLAEKLGALMGAPVEFTGEESAVAFLNDGRGAYAALGRPQVSVEQMLGWTADWVGRGGESLGKPTHFQVRDGKF